MNDVRDRLTARALTVSLDGARPDPRLMLSAATIIRHGGVVAHPTETFYGLAADPFSERAVAKLADLKGRGETQPVILLLPHAEAVFDLALIQGAAERWFDKLARAFWPGPLTFVLPPRAGLRLPAMGKGSTVAVRLSSHPVAVQLARTVGGAITSTSANLTGQPPPVTAAAIDPALASRLDLILDGGSAPGGPPSTLVDLCGERPALVREGAVPRDALEKILGMRLRAINS